MAGIPLHITPLSYIRGSGSQYITTDINLRSTDTIKSKWRFDGQAGNTYGCYTSGGANDNFCLYAGSSSVNAYIRYNGQVVREFKPPTGTIHELEQGPDGFFDNGVKLVAFTPATFTCSAPMYIFMLPNSTSAKVTARCYGLTIYRDGDQAYNFIPARNELTGEVGFYESVYGVFYENAGTGAFTAGPEVSFSVKTLLLKRRRGLMGLAKKREWYITDGLVMHFDGIEKGSNPNRWSDLVGSEYFTYNSNISSIESNAVVLNGTGALTGSNGSSWVAYNVGTIELCGQVLTPIAANGFFFSGNSGSGKYPLSVVKTSSGLMYTYARRSPNLYKFANLDTIITSPFSVSMNRDRGMLNGVGSTGTGESGFNNTPFSIGGKGGATYTVNARYFSIRLYNRKLSQEEMLHNLRIDNARFNLGLTI